MTASFCSLQGPGLFIYRPPVGNDAIRPERSRKRGGSGDGTTSLHLRGRVKRPFGFLMQQILSIRKELYAFELGFNKSIYFVHLFDVFQFNYTYIITWYII